MEHDETTLKLTDDAAYIDKLIKLHKQFTNMHFIDEDLK